MTVMGSFFGSGTECAGWGLAAAFALGSGLGWLFGNGLTGALTGALVAGAGETSGSGVCSGSGAAEATWAGFSGTSAVRR